MTLQHLPPLSHTWPSCVSLFSSPILYNRRTLPHPGRSHLKILILITSEDSISKEVHILRFRADMSRGTQFRPVQTLRQGWAQGLLRVSQSQQRTPLPRWVPRPPPGPPRLMPPAPPPRGLCEAGEPHLALPFTLDIPLGKEPDRLRGRRQVRELGQYQVEAEGWGARPPHPATAKCRGAGRPLPGPGVGSQRGITASGSLGAKP